MEVFVCHRMLKCVYLDQYNAIRWSETPKLIEKWIFYIVCRKYYYNVSTKQLVESLEKLFPSVVLQINSNLKTCLSR